MSGFLAALWAEALKARRSMILVLTAAAICLLPLAGALFIFILQDPVRARQMGLISAKAQLMVGVADWPSYFGILVQGMAAAGAVIFALIAAWVFGSEFTNRTAKELLAVPTRRTTIIAAKLVLLVFWNLALTILLMIVGLGVGSLLHIPGWGVRLALTSLSTLLWVSFLTILLMPLVAFLASAGRGYLAPIGWAFLTLALAQISAVLGWGDWFPWAVPALLSGAAGPEAAHVGLHSYLVVLAAFVAGVAATLIWWLRADQSR
jgi:ABC-2 type transport system permease protein